MGRASGQSALAATCARFAAHSPAGASLALPGPTGERNVYSVLPRAATACLAAEDRDLLTQLAAVLAVGSHALWQGDAAARLRQRLPAAVQQQVLLADGEVLREPTVGVVLQHGSGAELQRSAETLAQRPGAIVLLHGFAPGDAAIDLDRLVLERSLSVNTAAAGGNASLMTIG